ncbi:unnamed protein product [Ceratitis capitata]|uniref:(Mediterranean fruit fly) hypothetical protein n=1 Tax=Ceratitis capitata TaxID=7213 RepID=A0A811UDB0_CERCA|nr:unnamed protein product [Ceratitis capitata]
MQSAAKEKKNKINRLYIGNVRRRRRCECCVLTTTTPCRKIKTKHLQQQLDQHHQLQQQHTYNCNNSNSITITNNNCYIITTNNNSSSTSNTTMATISTTTQHLHHQQQQQQQQHAQYAAAAAAHAHAAAASGMRAGNGMPSMFGNTLGRGGCLYETNSSLVGSSASVVGGRAYDLDISGHHVGGVNVSNIASTAVPPVVVGVGGNIAASSVGGGSGYIPAHVNVSSVAVGSGSYNAGMSGMSAASESSRRANVGVVDIHTTASTPQHTQPPSQQQYQHSILPPERIKMEPLEQILTPTIEMEELIIKIFVSLLQDYKRREKLRMLKEK